jgi:hypothetical protein
MKIRYMCEEGRIETTLPLHLSFRRFIQIMHKMSGKFWSFVKIAPDCCRNSNTSRTIWSLRCVLHHCTASQPRRPPESSSQWKPQIWNRSGNLPQLSWRHNSEDHHLNLYLSENLKFRITQVLYQKFHGVTTQKTVTWIFIAVKTSNFE